MMIEHNISDEYPHFHLPVINKDSEPMVVMNGQEVVAIKFVDTILVWPDLSWQSDELAQ